MEDELPGPLDSSTTTQLTLPFRLWVLVRYDGLEFPGEVTSCGKTDAEASIMHKIPSAQK